MVDRTITVVLEGEDGGLRGTLQVGAEDARRFGDELDKAGDKAEDAGKRTKDGADRGAEGLGRLAKAGTAAAAVIVAATTAVVGLVVQQIRLADETGKTAAQFGVSTEALSGWRFAVERSGGSQQQLEQGLGRLSEQAAKAAGGFGEQARLFDAIGVSAVDSSGKLRSLEAILPEIADRFSKMQDGAGKAALAQQLLGDAGRELIPFLNEGAAGIAELTAQAAAMGVVVSGESATAAAELSDRVSDMWAQVKGFGQQLAAELLPLLNRLTQAFFDGDGSSRILEEGVLAISRAFRFLVGYAAVVVGAVRAIGAVFSTAYTVTREFVSGVFEALGASLGALSKYQSALTSLDFAGAKEALLQGPAAVAAAVEGTTERIAKALEDGKTGITDAITGVADVFVLLDDAMAEAGDGAEKSAEQIAKVTAPVVASSEALNKLSKAIADQVKEEERLAKARLDGRRAIEDLRAELDGPMARAVLAHQRAVEDLSAAYHSGELALADYVNGLELLDEQQRRQVIAIEEQGDVLGRFLAQIEAEKALVGLTQRQRVVAQAVQEVTAAYLENVRAGVQMTRSLAEVQKGAAEAAAGLYDLSTVSEQSADTLFQVFRDATTNLADRSPWEALRDAAVQNLDQILDTVGLIIEANQVAADGTVDWAGAFKELGDAAQEVLPQIGQFVGTALGGGGQGAQTGAAIGGAIGALFGPIGAAVGSILGGFIGGSFDDDPSVQVAGSRGSISGSVEQTRESAFGSFRVRTDEVEQPTSKQFADALEDFDNTIASFLSDDQIAAARARLESFDLTLEKGAVQIGLVLQARFEAILSTLPANIGAFVDGFSNDLQQQVQALSDVLALDRLAADDDLITDSLDGALALITEFGRAGETVGQTYARITQVTLAFTEGLVLMGSELDVTRDEVARMAVELGEAAGSTERATALLNSFYDTFYTETERLAARLTQATSNAQSEFGDIGLDVSQFTGEGGAQAFRTLFEETFPTLSAEARVQWLEAAQALGVLIDVTEAYQDSLSPEEIEQGVDAVTQLADLMAVIRSEAEQFLPPQTFAERIAAVNARTDELIAKAVALNATEAELGEIRALGQAQLQQIYDEQWAALRVYEDTARGVHDALAQLTLSDYQLAIRQADAEQARYIARLNEQARAAGFAGAATRDLVAVTELHAARSAAATARLVESIRAIASQLYGNEAAEIPSSPQAQFGNIISSGLEEANAANANFYDNLQRYIEQLNDYVNSLFLSELSPLTPEQRLQFARADFESTVAAARGGDPEAIARLQESLRAYLTELRDFYASGDLYQEGFASAIAAVRGIQAPGGGGTDPAEGRPLVSFGSQVGGAPPEAATAGTPGGRRDISRLELAQQLIPLLRDYLQAQNQSLPEAFAELGIDFGQYIEDLGITVEETTESVLALANLSGQMGVQLGDVAEFLDLNLGVITDATSLLNDTVEQVINGLPEESRAELEPLFRAVETATNEADANEAIANLVRAANDQPNEIRQQLAPFFQGIRTDTLVTFAETQTGYLSSIDLTLLNILAAVQPAPETFQPPDFGFNDPTLPGVPLPPPDPIGPTAAGSAEATVAGAKRGEELSVAMLGELQAMRSEIAAEREALRVEFNKLRTEIGFDRNRRKSRVT